LEFGNGAFLVAAFELVAWCARKLSSSFSGKSYVLTHRRWRITRWPLRQAFPFPAHID